MKANVLILIVTSVLINSVLTEPIFTVVGPSVLLTGKRYKCSVAVHGAVNNESTTLNITIQGTNYLYQDPLSYSISQIVQTDPNSNTMLVFKTEKCPPGNYKILVEGLDGLKYSSEQDLSFIPQRISMFIQTDKEFYEKNDIVRFRVYAMDHRTLPCNVKGETAISITDPAQNIIKLEYLNFTFVKGKFEGQFLLTSEPALGTWVIEASAEDASACFKTFDVAENVAPGFSASVSAPAVVLMTDGKFPVTVSAKGTFGQYVEGSAAVTFKLWDSDSEKYFNIFSKTVEIFSSVTTFDVDISNDLGKEERYLSYWSHLIPIEVEFTEKLTGLVATAYTQLELNPVLYKIKFKTPDFFKPGLPFSYNVAVEKNDGSQLPENLKLEITTSFDSTALTTTNLTLTLDDAGSKQIDIADVPLNVTLIEVNVRYERYNGNEPILDHSKYFQIHRFPTYQKEFISPVVTTKIPKVGQTVAVDIISTEDIQCAFYYIMSKGVLLDSKKVDIKDRKGKFSFTPTFAFAPLADIIVYYVSNGDIFCGTTSFKLRSNLSNTLKLSLVTDTMQAGEKTTLTVASKFMSTIDLSATETRNILRKTGNGISSDDVFDELEIFMSWRPQSRDRSPYKTYVHEFSEVNLVIFSNIIDRTPTIDYSNTSVYHPSYRDLSASRNKEELYNNYNNYRSYPEPTVAPKYFTETFLWQSLDIKGKVFGENEVNLTFTAPKSISSYVISGVSTSSIYGFGLPKTNPTLNVLMPFFIQMTLPYSIKRGEKLKQDVTTYNYQETEQTVKISIAKKTTEFEIVDSEITGWQNDTTSYFQTFQMQPNSIQKLSFFLKAKILGFVKLSVKAVASTAGDAIEQMLRVVPEGIPKSITSSAIILPKSASLYTTAELTCIFPPTAVSDTISISATVVGDIMGTALNNLDNLIQMPSGCGEQNMLNFVPDLAILRYLDASGKLTAATRKKIVTFLQLGYQRQMTFFREDGSYSVFGELGSPSSLWLTAFAMKSFVQTFNYIEEFGGGAFARGMPFLMSKQNADGSFREESQVIHKDMQGGSSSVISLTAYITLAFRDIWLSYKFDDSEFTDLFAAYDRAIAYIAANYDETDVYSLGIVSYALSLANHVNASVVREKFNAMAFETENEMHWEKTLGDSTQSESLDVEITGYGLLINNQYNISKALKISKWAVRQQNRNGGFRSTQDTVVILEALAKFSAKFSTAVPNLALKLTPNVGSIINVSVTKDNALVLQSFTLNKSAQKLGIVAPKGSTGVAIVSLTCNYYEVIEEKAPRFTIDHKFDNPCLGHLMSSVCVAYIAKPNDTTSNMVLVRMQLPSGFVYDTRSTKTELISRVEANNGGSEVSVYINSLTKDTTCFYINAIQINYLEDLKGGTIEVFDYYDTGKKASKMYSVPKLGQCETVTNPMP